MFNAKLTEMMKSSATAEEFLDSLHTLLQEGNAKANEAPRANQEEREERAKAESLAWDLMESLKEVAEYEEWPTVQN